MKPPTPAQPRAGAGPQPSRKLRAFFWDVLPDARIPGTFWEAQPPPYASLDTAEVTVRLPKSSDLRLTRLAVHS